MRVRITLTLDISREDWELSYGEGPDGLREDVKDYVLNLVNQSPAADADGIRSVTLH